MRVKTESDKHIRRCSRQRSSNEQSAENGNHAEETERGPAIIRRNIGITSNTEQ
jgi:hypothetical protein